MHGSIACRNRLTDIAGAPLSSELTIEVGELDISVAVYLEILVAIDSSGLFPMGARRARASIR